MIETRVIALGQRAAGDDGAGFAVLDELRRRAVPPAVELVEAADPTALIPLIETPARVVLVDAAVGRTPGQVIELADEIACTKLRSVSCHGLGVADVVALARQLFPARISPSIRIVVITIARPRCFRVGLSPGVAAAVELAADRVLGLALTERSVS